MLKQCLKYALYCLIVSVFLAHFAMAALSMLPPNPLKTFIKIPSIYVSGYFRQNWAFFAPEPLTSDLSFLVKCINTNTGEETPVWDIASSIHNRTKHAFFINRYDRAGYLIDNSVLSFRNEGKDKTFTDYCNDATNGSFCKELERKSKGKHRQSRERIIRIASSFCHDLGTYDSALIKLREILPSHWSERRNKKKEQEAVVIGDFGVVTLRQTKGFGVWK